MASLYRLDVSYPDGIRVPVRDPILGGDYLTRERKYARAAAYREAGRLHAGQSAADAVVCTRIYGAGSMRESFRVQVSA
jgi:hypothetical protein